MNYASPEQVIAFENNDFENKLNIHKLDAYSFALCIVNICI